MASEEEEFVCGIGSVSVEGGEIVGETGPEGFGQGRVVVCVRWVGPIQEAVGDLGLGLLGKVEGGREAVT